MGWENVHLPQLQPERRPQQGALDQEEEEKDLLREGDGVGRVCVCVSVSSFQTRYLWITHCVPGSEGSTVKDSCLLLLSSC